MSSATELEQTLARVGSAKERSEFIAEHDLALTAAVRREDAKIAGLCESWYEGKREEAAKYAGEEILALIKLQEQSALDAYRDSVLAKQVSPLLKLLQLIKDEGYCGNFQPELCAALKGSSDAAKEA